MVIPILFSIFLAVIHYWNEKFFIRTKTVEEKVLSFVGGASVAYVFLWLMPDLYKGVAYINQWIFIFIVLGFSLVHVSEKYFYQHAKKEKKELRLWEVHYAIFFLYYFIVGILLARFSQANVGKALLFLGPVIFYGAVSKISFDKVHIKIREKSFLRIVLSLSTLLGVLVSPFVLNSLLLYHILLAVIVGAFFYIAIMDFVPEGPRGKTKYFLSGLSLYTTFIVISWLFQ